MNRREVIIRLGAAAATMPLAAIAQPSGKVWRIGLPFIQARPPSIEDFPPYPFVEGMRALGYVEGRDFAMEWRFAYNRLPDRLDDLAADLAADLVRNKVDIIVAGISQVVAAAKKATPSIPIVMIFASDPVASGFATSLDRPGGNITGLRNPFRETIAKYVELLATTVPDLRKIGAVYDPAATRIIGYDAFTIVETAGRQRGVTVVRIDPPPVSDGLGAMFTKMSADGLQALIVLSNFYLFNDAKAVADLALVHKIAWMTGGRGEVRAGAPMAYGIDGNAAWRQGASFVDRIIKGASPAEMPIEPISRYEFAINLKTAKALGLIISPTLRASADEVIE